MVGVFGKQLLPVILVESSNGFYRTQESPNFGNVGMAMSSGSHRLMSIPRASLSGQQERLSPPRQKHTPLTLFYVEPCDFGVRSLM